MFIETLITLLITGTLLGAMSPVIVARKLTFLALSLTHVVLFSVAISIIVTTILEIPNQLIMLITFLTTWVMVMCIWFLINLGVKEDVATGIIVSVSAALSVIAIYTVLTIIPTRVSIWAYILGDPLLTTWDDLIIQLLVSAMILVPLVLLYRKFMYISLDYEYAKILGLRVKVLDLLLLTLITLSAVSLVRIVGIILLHIMYILPGIITLQLSKGIGKTLPISLTIGLNCGLLGYLLSLHINIAPSGALGLIATTAYILVTLLRVLHK